MRGTGPWVGMSNGSTGAFASLAELTRFQWAPDAAIPIRGMVCGTESAHVCRIARHRPYVPVNAKKPIELNYSVRFGYRGL